jgi:AcrR family transcriptional regulator
MKQETGTTQREKLSRDRVVEAALRIMDMEGLDAVTMRRVGRELGVEAMSLYNHVRDKDDLLDGIREHVLSLFMDPGTEGPWEERARKAARTWRQVLRSHPNTLVLISESKGPGMTPGAIRPTEITLRLLRETGLPEDDAVKAFCAFGGFIIGFVMFEVGMTRATEASVAESPTPEQLTAALPADEFPCFMASLPYLMQGDIDQRFEYGLDLLLTGLRAKAQTSNGSEAV